MLLLLLDVITTRLRISYLHLGFRLMGLRILKDVTAVEVSPRKPFLISLLLSLNFREAFRPKSMKVLHSTCQAFGKGASIC